MGKTGHVLGTGNPTQNNTISSLSTHKISHKKLTIDIQKAHFGCTKTSFWSRESSVTHAAHARRTLSAADKAIGRTGGQNALELTFGTGVAEGAWAGSERRAPSKWRQPLSNVISHLGYFTPPRAARRPWAWLPIHQKHQLLHLVTPLPLPLVAPLT